MNVFLKYKKEIADDTVLFGFEYSDEAFLYKPGQFLCLKLDLKYPDEKGPERFAGCSRHGCRLHERKRAGTVCRLFKHGCR